jgi:hypothetical protein
MTATLELPDCREIAFTPILEAAKPASQQQVAIVVDACAELDPTFIARYGLHVMPRTVRVDGQTMTLGPQRTLHHSCWEQPPRRIVVQPYALGELAQFYGAILDRGLNVLALHPPTLMDRMAQQARTARSILLAGPSSATEVAPRVAVQEIIAVGVVFAFLVEAAARGAAQGMALPQLLTFLDRLQATPRGYYITGMRGPVRQMRNKLRQAGVAPFGAEQVWELDYTSKRFVCRARVKRATLLFEPQQLLADVAPTHIRAFNTQLLTRLNAQRAKAEQEPLPVQPGGLSLMSCFPNGCIELAALPDEAHIEYILDVIRRIDRPAAQSARGILKRGGI